MEINKNMSLNLSTLEKTIATDLKAGVSWFEEETLEAGLALWNIFKAVFVALEPAEGQILIDVLSGAVAELGSGASIEDVETHALNTAKTEQTSVLVKAGSGIIQTVIAGIKASE